MAMNMNYSTELRKKIYASIVPIKYGSECGTAFFVSTDTLITARHIIYDSDCKNQPVIACVGRTILCDVVFIGEDGDNIDIVLLKCKDYNQCDCLDLLSDMFNENRQLTIVGYPKEFGNCTELISIGVQDRLGTPKEDYDTMVVRTDSLAFTSYKGFSGSPVLNEKGSVIGIAVNQYSSSLGYVSIKSIADRLEKKGITISHDWQSEDFSPLGRGTSQRQVEKAVSYVALRYNRELHVSDNRLDEDIDSFAHMQIENIEAELYMIEKEALKDSLKIDENHSIKDCLTNYAKGDFYGLYKQLKRLKGEFVERYMSDETKSFFKNEFPKLYPLIEIQEKANESIKILKGNAGMGKTHYLCATAERLCKEMNVYLLFGSRFVENRDFESQLYELMGIGGYDLDGLNDKMQKENANALILIDALNEGATEYFWDEAISFMEKALEINKHIKLIITYRNDENFDLHKSSMELHGFEGKPQEAMKKYFEHYGINDEAGTLRQKLLKDFEEPLFLLMFCIVAKRNANFMTGDFTYSDLFHQYIKYRNAGVSKGVDEDYHRNITEKALMKFASYSLYYNKCRDIPRQKARHYADQICRNRTWSNSLLYWLLKENLMLPTGNEGETLMFGYQKMGDFLMADIFAESKLSENEKIHFVLEKGCSQNDTNYRRFIPALLSFWKLTPELLEKEGAKNVLMADLILKSLKHYGNNRQAVLCWISKNNIYSPRILHDFFSEWSFEILQSVHVLLKDMDMATRDKVWSSKINEIYSSRFDDSRLDDFINFSFNKNSDDEWRKLIILLCWMCTTPHPFLRGKILRRLVALFGEKPAMALFALDNFYDCNDPYVVQVMTCALYGYLLRRHDAKASAEIAEKLLQYFYNDNKGPEDILVRQWTMLALSLADELNDGGRFFNCIEPPFASQNPFPLIADGKEQIDKNYFGASKGSQRMYETLYGFSDFNRYIIGTNNHSVSYVFMKKSSVDVDALPLADIMQLIANIAKHDFKWNDDLGTLDNDIYSFDRYNNIIERFGKKYLWLALYKADALLSDNYYVVDESRHVFSPSAKDVEQIPYPWHTQEYSRIDPSIIDKSDALTYRKFKASVMEDVMGISNEQWLAEDYPIQTPRLILSDEDDSEWIVLTCYDGHKTEAENETVKDLFLFSNAAFIKNEEFEVFKEWAKAQNFYGRWMPECRNGSIDYLWNEYPWAPTYKRTIHDIQDYSNSVNEKSFSLQLSYESQLQEDWTGQHEDDFYLREVCMPNHNVMSELNLYTAERGVIRDKRDNSIIVARNFTIGRMHGLAIKKGYLVKYLSENNMSVVFYSVGEKYVRGKDNYHNIGERHELSGAYFYDEGEIKEIQAMHISGTI